MHTRLDRDVFDAALARIERSQRPARPLGAAVPPVSTLRVAAQHFRHDSAHRAGGRALRLLQSYAPDSIVLARALRLPGWEGLPTDPVRVDQLLGRLDSGASDVHPVAILAHEVYRRVIRRLQSAPVQDLRIDFHDPSWDGGGTSGRDEADALASTVATEVALAMREGTLPPRLGIRLPPLVGAGAVRGIRTADVFLSTLVDRASALPQPFVISLAELTHEDQVSAAAQVCGTLEARLGLPRGTLRFELGIGDPSIVFEESGVCRLPTVVGAAAGRCDAVRIDAVAMARALCARDPAAAIAARDLARLSLAGLGIPISWGTSPDLPRNHRPRGVEDPQRHSQIHAAWRAHADSVSRALKEGYFWGWDHDAGQIPARLVAVGTHYRQLLPVFRSELASVVGTNAPLLEEIRIGLACGALSPEDLAGTGFEGT